MAEREYPTKCAEEVADGRLEAKLLTECAEAWLKAHPDDPGKELMPKVPDRQPGCCS